MSHSIRTSSLLVLLLFSGIFLSYVQAVDIVLNYTTQDFDISNQKGVSYIFSKGKQPIFDSDTQSPALPFFCTYILIGADEDFVSYSYSIEETPFATDIHLDNKPQGATTPPLLPWLASFGLHQQCHR